MMSEWISVDDRLPEINQKVLLLICYGDCNSGFYSESEEVVTGGREENDGDHDWFVGNKPMNNIYSMEELTDKDPSAK